MFLGNNRIYTHAFYSSTVVLVTVNPAAPLLPPPVHSSLYGNGKVKSGSETHREYNETKLMRENVVC